MAISEIEKRRSLALDSIKQAFGTESGEDSVGLFIEHHIAELPESYWLEHLNTTAPDPEAVLGLIVFRSSWGKKDIEYFDFTLPGQVTDYVVSAHFNSTGEVDELSMES